MTPKDLEIIRDALDVNWTELADDVGVSIRQLYNYRTGDPIPRKVQLACEALLYRAENGPYPEKVRERISKTVRRMAWRDVRLNA